MIILTLKTLNRCVLGCGLALVALASTGADATAKSFRLLHTFGSGTDGTSPEASLVADKAGNLYGTTFFGGTGTNCSTGGCGTVFKIARDGTETVLHSFGGSPDGADPETNLVIDKAGNLYGTTTEGGANGGGTIFKFAPDGTESVLVSLDDGSPEGNVVADGRGNLYGTTPSGGTFGGGTLFKSTPKGAETVLYSFGSGSDGNGPSGVIIDKAGNLYGTTFSGGTGTSCGGGCGTVFKITPDGTETVLYNFCSQANCTDGAVASGPLLLDAAGNIYGTTQIGGSAGGGTLFKLAADGTETVLYSFCSRPNCRDGVGALSGVVADKQGNFYGTTQSGGAGVGYGTVFEVAPDGTETVLYSLTIKRGANPLAGLLAIRDTKNGTINLYGTAQTGGAYSEGTVFKVTK